MKSLLYLILFFLVLDVHSQPLVNISGVLYNAPGTPVQITFDIQANPPQSYTVTTNNSGFFNNFQVTLSASGYSIVSATFLDCQGTSQVYTLPNTFPEPQTDLFFALDYCSNGSVYGCTDVDALNFSPIAVFEDGSCIFSEQAVNDECQNALPLEAGITLVSNENAFYEPEGNSGCDGLNFTNIEASAWYSFTTPDYPVSVSISTHADGSNTLTDTQISVRDRYCGGLTLACDENSGDQNFSSLYIECGVLRSNATYLVRLNGVQGDMGTCFISLEYDSLCSVFMGCTNALSSNFNPLANTDDGTCFDPDVMHEFSISFFGSESLNGSWSILLNGSVVHSGVYEGGSMVYNGEAPQGCYEFQMNIPVGEGESGYFIFSGEIDPPFFNSDFFEGIMDIGIYYCPDFNYFGCLDTEALNYNPEANNPNGICHYLPECGSSLTLETRTTSCNEIMVYSVPYYPELTWTLLDGTPLEAGNNYVIFTPEIAGIYTICGMAGVDNCGSPITSCIDIQIDEVCFSDCPTAIVQNSELSGCGVSFNLNVTPINLGEVSWDFGDGSSAISVGQVYHEYDASGPMLVCATVLNPTCSSPTICDTVYVTQCGPDLIFGCLDPEALNYNPAANTQGVDCVYSSSCAFYLSAVPDTVDTDLLLVIPSVDISLANSVLWDFGDGFSSTEYFPEHLFQENGPFELCLTAEFILPGEIVCSNMACVLIDESMVLGSGFASSGFRIQVQNSDILSVKPDLSNYSMHGFPNPASSIFNIQFEGFESFNTSSELIIYDLNGKAVLSRIIAPSDFAFGIELDVNTIAPGFYFAYLQLGDEVIVRKMEIVR